LTRQVKKAILASKRGEPMKKIAFALVLMLVIAGFAACGDQEPKEEVTFDETRCPIEVVSSSKTISPIPTFLLTVKNVSPYDVTGFNAGAIFFDVNGKPLSTEPEIVPFEGSLDPIKPDSSVELQSIGDENASSMKVVIKDCIYMKANPVDKIYGDLPYSWKNPDYDKQVKAVLEGK
jgi:hypothetical protein